jgi:hypothetical protein
MSPLVIIICPTSILKCLYGHTPFASTIHVTFIQSRPFSGPYINLLEHIKINVSKYVYFDAAYFMMLTKDLPALFGIMVCSAN